MKALVVLLPALFVDCLATNALSSSFSCDPSTLNSTSYLYPITTANTTFFSIAAATKRGACDIGPQNLMADVTIIPNGGQQIFIPLETCHPDNDTCILPNITRTGTCVSGGPELLHRNGDTYEIIARRLNITTESLTALALGDEAARPNDRPSISGPIHQSPAL
ncbi:hypothetical protein BDW66DRAFT_125237 [Aspergillus desertorum]